MAQVRGKGEVKRRLALMTERIPLAVQSSMQQEAAAILGKTEVPVRSGDLRGSAFVGAPEGSGRGAAVRFGFRARYAVYVNRMTGFFSRVLRSSRRGILGRLAKRTAADLTAKPAGEFAAATQVAKERKRKARR